MTDALTPVLVESALRSLLLGAAVWSAARLTRLRDLRAETAIWTVVLLAALAMPLLAAALPAGVELRLLVPVLAQRPGSVMTGAASLWALSPGLILTVVYGLGVLIGLARLVAGVVLMRRLYAKAEPVDDDWACGKAIRFSPAIEGPVSFARCILLPAGYRQWSETKRLAVLAHEECHIRRGDFYIQLLASLHRALFWFSPFAWWLQRKLGELAESASDAAGVRRIGDPAGYAEILVDVARQAHCGTTAGAMAMAHGPGLAKRIDHVLAQPSERALGRAARLLALGAVVALSLGLAEIHAAPAQTIERPGTSPLIPAGERQLPSRAARPGVAARVFSSPGRNLAARKTLAAVAVPPAPATTGEALTYNPRALLDDPEAVVLPVVIATRARVAAAPSQAGGILTAGSGD